MPYRPTYHALGERRKAQVSTPITQPKRWLRHIMIWTVIWLLFTLGESILSGHALLQTSLYEAVNLAFYAGLIYLNFYWLIPRLLLNQKFLKYAIYLIGAAVLLAPIKTFALYFVTSSDPEWQANLLLTMDYTFIAMFLVGGASTVVKIILDWSFQARERKKLETQTMQSELRFLKSQINPHFLFNTLNSLYAHTLKKSDEAPEIVLKLSEMMRYMLYECNEKQVPLEKEVKYIKNYLDLERIRQGNTAEVTFDVAGDIRHQKVTPLLFIPFLENSFKHGVNHQLKEGFVRVYLDVAPDEITFFIENSKPPQTQIRKTQFGGIGLTNVERRLNLLYPDRHELSIENTPHSYSVTLQLGLDSET